MFSILAILICLMAGQINVSLGNGPGKGLALAAVAALTQAALGSVVIPSHRTRPSFNVILFSNLIGPVHASSRPRGGAYGAAAGVAANLASNFKKNGINGNAAGAGGGGDPPGGPNKGNNVPQSRGKASSISGTFVSVATC